MYTWQTFYLLSHFLSTYSSISYINTENRCYPLVFQTRTLIDDPVSPSIRVPILSVSITRWKGVRSTSLSRLLMGPSFSLSVSISPGSCFILFPLIQSRNEEFAVSIRLGGSRSLSENFKFSHSHATLYLSSNAHLHRIICSWASLPLSSEMQKPHNKQRVKKGPKGLHLDLLCSHLLAFVSTFCKHPEGNDRWETL